ncbi:SRPBCC family protein [bacterium]|nr:SRPBCC family protein [bacterium]
MSSTTIRRHVKAPRERVYRAIIDADDIAKWMFPEGMTIRIYAFDARVGGKFRISLTYDDPAAVGKSNAHTDTYHGRFVELEPNEKVVEVVEFETDNPAMQGEMTVTITLADTDGGTEILAIHDGLPPGLSPADNETGWNMSLDNLARLVETD